MKDKTLGGLFNASGITLPEKIDIALDEVSQGKCIICAEPTRKDQGLCGCYRPKTGTKLYFYKLCQRCSHPVMRNQVQQFIEDMVLLSNQAEKTE